MRQALVLFDGMPAADLIEHSSQDYELVYHPDYNGRDISLTLPRKKNPFRFNAFPAFFEGLLPEGAQLNALLRQKKIDERDFFAQLIATGDDLVGAITVRVIT